MLCFLGVFLYEFNLYESYGNLFYLNVEFVFAI
jgi:hypothetical protein